MRKKKHTTTFSVSEKKGHSISRRVYMKTIDVQLNTVLVNILPETGLVRLSQILGDKKKGIPPIIPVSRSAWWLGVKKGIYPKPIKLSDRVTCWHAEEIRDLIGKAARS